MAIRAVIDTNIWVSAILNPFGFPSRLRKSFAEGLFQPVISEPMFLELAEVLTARGLRDTYGLAAADIKHSSEVSSFLRQYNVSILSVANFISLIEK